ncbi:hypothetical protein OG571_47200 (plasmid) [Streptomyces sp. NBC_01369]|uniref:hypothetical protein n=1 Tax=Streptomyces sp. NBC_01369 TaxID=2903842 RepID=UPI002F909674
MARIQILELPEGAGDSQPPFALVVDQVEPQRYVLGMDQEPLMCLWENVAKKLGARAVLVFEETIEIPANEVPIGPDGYPIRLHFEGDFTRLREQAMREIAQIQADMKAALK